MHGRNRLIFSCLPDRPADAGACEPHALRWLLLLMLAAALAAILAGDDDHVVVPANGCLQSRHKSLSTYHGLITKISKVTKITKKILSLCSL